MDTFAFAHKNAERRTAKLQQTESPDFEPISTGAAPSGPILYRKASCACGGGCPSCQAGSGSLRISQPDDAAEIEADAIADRVMRMPNDRTPAFDNVRSHDNSIPRVKTDPAVVHRQGEEVTDEEPDPLTEGLGTVAENLSENNPAFSEFTENLGEQFMSQPPALSVGVPVFLGANYAFLWGMAMANPAMRRHFNDFNIAMLPGIVPQFPIKTFTYRILNDEQTRFEFDFGLDASALMEAFNEGVLNTHVSTLSFESSGGLNTEAASRVSLSALQVNLGLFDDGLMLSGGFRQGVSPYPLMERNAMTGETSQIGAQFPAMPDLFPERQDVRFMLQLDVVRLYNYFNAGSTPIRSVPQQIEGDTVHRKSNSGNTPTSAGPFRGVPSSAGQPLDRDTRAFFEPRIGQDLSGVRVHTGDGAAESARAVDARAYTIGREIVFADGEYAPHSESGRHLIAHELAHVVQGAEPNAGSDVIHRQALTSEDVWGFIVTRSMCGCRQGVRDDIDWANTAAGTYAACDTPLNTTSTAVEACFDAAQPGTTIGGSTSSSGTMTLPPPTADPCERIRNRATFVHETMHSRHTDSIARAQGAAFFAEWRRLTGNPNRLSLLSATFPAEVAAFRAQWRDGHDWAQDEVNSYRWERRFLVDVRAALNRICS